MPGDAGWCLVVLGGDGGWCLVVPGGGGKGAGTVQGRIAPVGVGLRIIIFLHRPAECVTPLNKINTLFYV